MAGCLSRGGLFTLFVLSGCLQSASVDCPNGGVCPEGLRCGTARGILVCVPSACGNGRHDPGEACDDGNNVSGDGCPADCTPPCGDGILDPGEACDDGNSVSGDGCSNDCRSKEVCGNGILDPGEACDDGNTVSGDGCSNDCRTKEGEVCGNGAVTAGEDCDDGNLVDGDGCDASCHFSACLTEVPVVPGAGSSFPIAGQITKLIADPMNCFVYALDAGSPSHVIVISTASKRELTRITLLEDATDLAISPSGAYLVVSHVTTAISIIDTATWRATTRVPTFADPNAIAVTDNGIAFYAEPEMTIHHIDLRDSSGDGPGVTLLFYADVALSRDGHSLYVGEAGTSGSHFAKYDVSGGNMVLVDESHYNDGGGGFYFPPRYVYVSPGGQHVYYANYQFDTGALDSIRGSTGELIYAEDVHGTFAIGADHVFDAKLVRSVAMLPHAAAAAVLTADDQELWYYSVHTGRIYYLSPQDLIGGVALGVREVVSRLVAEPPGAHCSAGGTAVQSGLDQNRNGRLDDAEVTHTDYVCREALLTRIAAEPAGPNCIAGGVAFFAGTDRDGDGVLDDAEIEATEFVCGDVVTRDVVIHSDVEAAALAPIRVITGGVTVQLTAMQSLSLPQLEHIGGSLRVLDNAHLTRLALPALQAVDGDVTLTADALTTVDCPQLQRAGGLDLELVLLQHLSGFPALGEVDGDVRISDMPALVSAELPQASGAGDLSISANPALVHVAWDLTDHLGRVDIHNNPKLETIDLSMNTFFGGPARVGPVVVTANPVLGHLGLRAKHVASFAIGAEPVLTDIQLPVGNFDRDVTIVDVEFPFNLIMNGDDGAMEIVGNLMVSGPVATFDPGDCCLTVDGRFVLDSTRLQALTLFHSSIRVGQGLRVSNNTRLTDLSAFEVSPVADLEVTGNAVLFSFNPTLALFNEIGAVVITDNPLLTSAPALAQVSRVHGAANVERNPLLAGLFGPKLVQVEGPVRVVDNASLADLQLPELEGVGSSLEISSNAALQTLALPALPEVTGALTVDGNPQLHHIDLTSLADSGDFQVDNNPQLPTCEILAVFGHTTGLQEQSGNDDAASCSP